MQHTTVFFSLPQNSRCLVIEFHEKKNSIILLLGRRKFLCFVNSNRVLGIGENPNSYYTNKCAMPPPHAVYESIFCDFFSREAIYFIYPAVVGSDVNKDYYLPIYYMMIFLRQRTLAFIILYNFVAY